MLIHHSNNRKLSFAVCAQFDNCYFRHFTLESWGWGQMSVAIKMIRWGQDIRFQLSINWRTLKCMQNSSTIIYSFSCTLGSPTPPSCVLLDEKLGLCTRAAERFVAVSGGAFAELMSEFVSVVGVFDEPNLINARLLLDSISVLELRSGGVWLTRKTLLG